jgi:hypothetical protein
MVTQTSYKQVQYNHTTYPFQVRTLSISTCLDLCQQFVCVEFKHVEIHCEVSTKVDTSQAFTSHMLPLIPICILHVTFEHRK